MEVAADVDLAVEEGDGEVELDIEATVPSVRDEGSGVPRRVDMGATAREIWVSESQLALHGKP